MLPRLSQVSLRSGEVIEIADGTTAIVGPNNAGKTRLLVELLQLLHGQEEAQADPRVIVSSLSFDWPGDAATYEAWVDREYDWRPPGPQSNGNYVHDSWLPLRDGTIMQRSNFIDARAQSIVGPIAGAYVRNFDVDSRVGYPFESQMYNRRNEHPSNAIQAMWADRGLEDRISGQIQEAFGRGLVIDRAGGNHIATHFGSDSGVTPESDLDEYDRIIAGLPKLANQGHGVRSLAGILLALSATQHRLVVIDEPEAFLHPPQARLLGEILAAQHDQSKQVIVATHSEEILQGLSDWASAGAGQQVSITRITRTESGPHRSQIPTDLVSGIKSDALLRYSTVLNGLFFKGTVVCEGDGDCTYYRAVLNYLRAPGTEPADIHFMHCNGKSKIFRAVEILREAEVPVSSVVDMDWLRQSVDFNRLVHAHGLAPAEVQGLRTAVVSAVEASEEAVTRREALVQLIEVLAERGDEPFTDDDRDEVRQRARPSRSWDTIKRRGREGVPSAALDDFDTLNRRLRDVGIYMVPVGELESFHTSAPRRRKAIWLANVLENELYRTETASHQFVQEIADSLLQVPR